MSILSLFGCSSSTPSQKEPNIDEIAQLIVEAFEENSVGPIQDILSESALNTKDLCQGIEYGNKLLKNEGDLTINNDGGYEGDGWESGKYYKWRRCFFIVEGDKNSFMLVFHYFLKNDFYPEDKGLYRIYFAPKKITMLKSIDINKIVMSRTLLLHGITVQLMSEPVSTTPHGRPLHLQMGIQFKSINEPC